MKKTDHRARNNHIKPLVLFLITFVGILLVGVIILLLLSIKKNNQKTASLQPESKKKSSQFELSWENIPEEKQEEIIADNSRYGKELSDPAYMEQNGIHFLTTAKKDELTITFAGDILFDDEYAVMANLLRRGQTIENGISVPLLEKMRQSDLMIVNNEFPYTTGGAPLEGKTYTFRADPSCTSYLKDMGVDVVTLANNHMYDFGEKGLLDTLETLDTAGICHIGAGKDINEASAPAYFICNDRKIAILSATQIERLDNPDTKGATETSPGVFRCWNPELLLQRVAEAKQNSDFVIVCMHWGTENVSEPDWAQLDQAPKLSEAGADLIIGTHPHCLQGITYFGNTPVIYSLGNFWFNSKTIDTGMVQVVLNQEGLKSFTFIPAIQNDSRVSLAEGSENERILSYMRSLSPGVQIETNGEVSNNAP